MASALIPGTGKVEHLEENIEATNLELTAEDLKEIYCALSEFKDNGGRMSPAAILECTHYRQVTHRYESRVPVV